MANVKSLVLRGETITEDTQGNILLDDIWRLAKAKESKSPKYWRRSQPAKDLIQELQLQVTNSNLRDNKRLETVIYAKRGQSGTFAHPILAAAYAGHLSAKLEIEVREIWLRYRAGDATLADQILQRASKEANLWAGVRAMARAQRISYTDALKAHGVEGIGYSACTNAVYERLFGGKANKLRRERGLPPKANLRNHLDVAELSYVAAAEALSSERIEEEYSEGNAECAAASGASATSIRRAIEDDRRNRQQKLRLRG